MGICDWGGCEVLVYLQMDYRSKAIMTCFSKVDVSTYMICDGFQCFFQNLCWVCVLFFTCKGGGGVPDNDPFGKFLGCFWPIFGNFIKICNLIMTKGLGFIF